MRKDICNPTGASHSTSFILKSNATLSYFVALLNFILYLNYTKSVTKVKIVLN